MAHNDLTDQPAELHCSSCGNLIPPEDVTEGKARQAPGEVLCAVCADAREKAGASTCRRCGNRDLPLFDGKNYLCRQCGTVLKLERRVTSAEKNSKAPGQFCPSCGTETAASARQCPSCGEQLRVIARPAAASTSSALTGYLVGAAVTAVLFLAGIIFYQKINPPAPAPNPAQSAIDTTAISRDIHANVLSTVEATLRSNKDEMLTAVAKVFDMKMEPVRQRLDKLEKASAEKPAERPAPAETAAPKADETDLTAVLTEIKNKQDQAAAQPAAIAPAVQPPVKPDTSAKPDTTKPDASATPEAVKPAPAAGPGKALVDAPEASPTEAANTTEPPAAVLPAVKPDTSAEKPADTAANQGEVKDARPPTAIIEVNEKEDTTAATTKLKDDAKKLADAKKFAEALALLDIRPDIRDALWQAEREKAKQDVRKRAEELFRMDLARAEGLVRGGKYKEARDVYRQAAAYGLPEMVEEATKRLAEIKVAPGQEEPAEADTPVAAAPEDPQVIKCLGELRDKQAAQHVRTNAAKKLGELKAASAVDDLIAALDDRDWYLRVCAAGALEQIGDIRAVPALIRNLKHLMIPVSEAAHEALGKITGRDFGKDTEKWWDWWKKEGGRSLPPAVREKLQQPGDGTVDVPKESQEFESQIIIYKEAERTVTLAVKGNYGLKLGQKLDLSAGAKKLCTIELTLIGFGNATGKITDLQQGALLKIGTIVTAQKL